MENIYLALKEIYAMNILYIYAFKKNPELRDGGGGGGRVMDSPGIPYLCSLDFLQIEALKLLHMNILFVHTS